MALLHFGTVGQEARCAEHGSLSETACASELADHGVKQSENELLTVGEVRLYKYC
jgi:hypothetical protein